MLIRHFIRRLSVVLAILSRLVVRALAQDSTLGPPSTGLACASAPMNQCAFYADCLESRYHCGPDRYPIGDGQHYCQKFSDNCGTLSARGQRWMIDNMHCLPLVGDAVDANPPAKHCQALEDQAFASHPPCLVLFVERAGLGGSVRTLLSSWDAFKAMAEIVGRMWWRCQWVIASRARQVARGYSQSIDSSRCSFVRVGGVTPGFVQSNMTALSKAEKSYIQSSLLSDPPLRLDGRSLEDYRPIALETGVVPLANGSAKVCIGRPGRGGYVQEAGGVGGGSEVVVGVKLEVAGVGDEEEGGKIACTVSCSPAAYPSFSSNALDDLQSDLTILLESVLSHPTLRPDNLVIVPGKKAWAAKLDAVVFADGGNIVDCLMLASRAALWDTKVPRTKAVEYRAPRRQAAQADIGMDVDTDEATEEKGSLETKDTNDVTDFELTDYWDEGEVLGGRDTWPVCVTLNVLSNAHFLDATQQEEASVPLRMHLMYAFPKGEPPILQTFRLVGLEVSTMDQIRDLLKRAEIYARNAWTRLEAKLSDEEARRGVKAREKFYSRLR